MVAVNHDHYFKFRLDVDVDGATNSFVADRLVSKTLPADHPRRSIWVRQASTARTESEGMLHVDMERPALWRVVSTARTNHVGYPTSYQLVPGMTAATLLAADDYPRRRAGFIDHSLWVTPYQPQERYAAGDYPTLSTPGQGLPAWTRANRRIEHVNLAALDDVMCGLVPVWDPKKRVVRYCLRWLRCPQCSRFAFRRARRLSV